jgi:hypothetical protein
MGSQRGGVARGEYPKSNHLLVVSDRSSEVAYLQPHAADVRASGEEKRGRCNTVCAFRTHSTADLGRIDRLFIR